MSVLRVVCSEPSKEIIDLANRLDGEMTEYLVCDRKQRFSFFFPKETFAKQFHKAVILYPQVLEVIA